MKNETMNQLPEYWKKIIQCADKNIAIDNGEQLAKFLYYEYTVKGYITAYTLKEILQLPDAIIFNFFRLLYQSQQNNKMRPELIVSKEKDTKWMFERDYCFFNIRATGSNVEETGNIMDSVKLLPILRVTGIHLAPFFECSQGIIYCQNSFYRINHEIVNEEYLKFDVTAEEQLQFFIDCCHLLNLAVGFDFVPHTSFDSALRLERPELFRWIRLDEKRKTLFENMDIDEQYSDAFQAECHKQIKIIVQEEKEKWHVKKIDIFANHHHHLQKTIVNSNKRMIEEGFYTVPPHTWNGVAVPGFKKYSSNIHRTIWEYKDKYGNEQGQHAIWLHANFYLHKKMKANKIVITNGKSNVSKNSQVFLFIKEYLKETIRNYNFDYIRIDYVDHIFDNIAGDGESEIPLNETLTPGEILDIITALRKEWPGLGLQADHFGRDEQRYSKAGFNLIIDSSVAVQYNRFHLRKIFNAFMVREKNNTQCRALFAIDTQDLAHPLFLGKELALREGKIGVIVRFFMSRFANVGKSRQPKYEVIGNQDFSIGIHRANNRPESIYWGNDKEILEVYNEIENQYKALKDKLKKCRLLQYSIGYNRIFFVVGRNDQSSKWLGVMPIPVKTMENREEIDSFSMDIEKEEEIRLHTRMSYKISGKGQINRGEVDEILDIKFDRNFKKMLIKGKEQGLALLELKKRRI